MPGRKENDKLRQEIKDIQTNTHTHGEANDTVRRLERELEESDARCQETTKQLNAEREKVRLLQVQQEPLRKLAEQAEASTKMAVELERKVKHLSAQLRAASNDLDEAARHELNRQEEVEKLKMEIGMQQMDIVSLQNQLGEAVVEDSALRLEKDEEIENMHARMVSKQELELCKQDNEALQNKISELRQMMQEQDQDDKLRIKIKEIANLETHLAEATSMWHAAARDGQDLRKRISELEALQPQTAATEESLKMQNAVIAESLKRQIVDRQDALAAKDAQLEAASKRIASLTAEMHALSGRLAQSRSEHMQCLERISEMTQNTVQGDVHARVKESMELALTAEREENLRLKDQIERLREELQRRASTSIGTLHGLHHQMLGLESTMQVIEQAGFTLKTGCIHEIGRLQQSNRDLERSVLHVSRDLQNEKKHVGLVDSEVQMQIRLLREKTEHEGHLREREQTKTRIFDDVMNEMALRILEAEGILVTSEQYLRDLSRALRVAPPNLPSSPTKFRTLPALSLKDRRCSVYLLYLCKRANTDAAAHAAALRCASCFWTSKTLRTKWRARIRVGRRSLSIVSRCMQIGSENWRSSSWSSASTQCRSATTSS